MPGKLRWGLRSAHPWWGAPPPSLPVGRSHASRANNTFQIRCSHTHTLRVRLRRCGSSRRLRVLKQIANSRIVIIPGTLNNIRTTSWVSRLWQLRLLALHRSLTWELGRPTLQNSGMGQRPRGKPKCMKSRKPSFVIQTLR